MLPAELLAAHVQAMFTAVGARHHQDLRSPVSAATLSRIGPTLRAALNAAIRSGLIAGNPASRAELRPARRPRAVVWTPARVERSPHGLAGGCHAGIEWRRTSPFLDEIPGAYKPIDTIMNDAKDLVPIDHELRQIVNVKGD